MVAKAVDDDVDRAYTAETKRPETKSPETKGDDLQTDLQAENQSLRERLMRALAETENTRRQGERRAEDAQKYAITTFARELLQVVDNLRRAIDAGAARSDAGKQDGLVEGVAATDQILTQVLKRFGVEKIDALNKPFDPEKHEAVMEMDATDQPPRSVVQVLENGYMLHDRLLRPARVAVAKPQQPSSRAADQ